MAAFARVAVPDIFFCTVIVALIITCTKAQNANNNRWPANSNQNRFGNPNPDSYGASLGIPHLSRFPAQYHINAAAAAATYNARQPAPANNNDYNNYNNRQQYPVPRPNAPPRPPPSRQQSYRPRFNNPNPAPQQPRYRPNPNPAPQQPRYKANPNPAPQQPRYNNPNPAPAYGSQYGQFPNNPAPAQNYNHYPPPSYPQYYQQHRAIVTTTPRPPPPSTVPSTTVSGPGEEQEMEDGKGGSQGSSYYSQVPAQAPVQYHWLHGNSRNPGLLENLTPQRRPTYNNYYAQRPLPANNYMNNLASNPLFYWALGGF